jgi:type IV secretory pathway VirB6-like protein
MISLSVRNSPVTSVIAASHTAHLADRYFAEYAMQSGAWAAIGFPESDSDARGQFYTYANWCYQGGVFISRSSGLLFQVITNTSFVIIIIIIVVILIIILIISIIIIMIISSISIMIMMSITIIILLSLVSKHL